MVCLNFEDVYDRYTIYFSPPKHKNKKEQDIKREKILPRKLPQTNTTDLRGQINQRRLVFWGCPQTSPPTLLLTELLFPEVWLLRANNCYASVNANASKTFWICLLIPGNSPLGFYTSGKHKNNTAANVPGRLLAQESRTPRVEHTALDGTHESGSRTFGLASTLTKLTFHQTD